MKKALTSLSIVAGSVSYALAQVTLQQGQTNTTAINNLVVGFGGIIAKLAPIAVTLAVLAFFWFLIEFIWKGREDATAKTRSLSGMGYAILAIFVMVSIWGLVGFLGSVTGVGQGGNVPTPGVVAPN